MNAMLVKIIIHVQPEMPKTEQQGAVVNVKSANWALNPCASLQEDVNWPVNVFWVNLQWSVFEPQIQYHFPVRPHFFNKEDLKVVNQKK